MQNRYIPLVCLLFSVVLLVPQSAQTFDDETLKEKVKPSIEAGVEFLKSAQINTGVWPLQVNQAAKDELLVGSTALAAIALMECGVSPRDRQVQAAYKVVRSAVSNQKFTYNYSTCLSLLLLDRINRENGLKHKDADLILELARRIANGQASNGGWGYNYPSGAIDNSNTQFAVVALWVSRKYRSGGIIDRALAIAEQRFRRGQQADGGWGYESAQLVAVGANHSTGSMTCAGILGIALHAGTRGQSAAFRGAGGTNSSGDIVQQLDADPQIAKARAFILRSLMEHINGTLKGPSDHLHGTYFFWSLERVATLYKWRKLDGVDWFEKGATYLMSIQQRNGSWSLGGQGNVIDTSFTLLFLAKSNLLGSLTETAFEGGALGDAPTISKEKKTEAKPVDNKMKAKELAEKLINALPNQQADLLAALTEGKGSDYTDALVNAITKLSTNASKEAAREALAARLQRMKTSVLGDYMLENDRELRLAAAVAVRLKNDPTAAANLIPLLADSDIGVSTAALDSLKALSGQDFGKSVERWSRWLDTVPKKP